MNEIKYPASFWYAVQEAKRMTPALALDWFNGEVYCEKPFRSAIEILFINRTLPTNSEHACINMEDCNTHSWQIMIITLAMSKYVQNGHSWVECVDSASEVLATQYRIRRDI